MASPLTEYWQRCANFSRQANFPRLTALHALIRLPEEPSQLCEDILRISTHAVTRRCRWTSGEGQERWTHSSRLSTSSHFSPS